MKFIEVKNVDWRMMAKMIDVVENEKLLAKTIVGIGKTEDGVIIIEIWRQQGTDLFGNLVCRIFDVIKIHNDECSCTIPATADVCNDLIAFFDGHLYLSRDDVSDHDLPKMVIRLLADCDIYTNITAQDIANQRNYSEFTLKF